MNHLLLDTNDWRLKQIGVWREIRGSIKERQGVAYKLDVIIKNLTSELDPDRDQSTVPEDRIEELICTCEIWYRKSGLPFFRGGWNHTYITLPAIVVERRMQEAMEDLRLKPSELLLPGQKISDDDHRAKEIIFQL